MTELLYALSRVAITIGAIVGLMVAIIVGAKLVQVGRGLWGIFGDLLDLWWARRFLRDMRRVL